MAEGFWAITIIMILAWKWYKANFPKDEDEQPEYTVKPKTIKSFRAKDSPEAVVDDEDTAAERQRKQDIADLKKKGYSDEVIAVILPTINNGQ